MHQRQPLGWKWALLLAAQWFAVPAALGLFSSLAAAADGIDSRYMVATVNPLATEAGIRAFEKGGNAVDAAVAAALMLGVVDSHNSGIGGGCFILIHTATDRTIVIDGRERAPGKASRDMYLVDGKADPELSRTGPLAAATPGSVAAYAEAVKEWGKLPLANGFEFAADRAEEGFEIDELFAARLSATAAEIKKFPATAKVFLDADGKPLPVGSLLKQPDLAQTYRQIAKAGPAWFYEGEFAAKTADYMSKQGGLLTKEDFAKYETARRRAVSTSYRGYEVYGFPTPSSGGTHVAQILNTVEFFDLKGLHDKDPALYMHVVAEAMKLAFADRAYWLGDSDFVDVPKGLTDKGYAAGLAKRINLEQATEVKSHGRPPGAKSSGIEKHTTHIAAADAEGNWVAITTTLNTSFGSKVMVPGTGVLLNNQMDDFSAQPGVPNAFGLVGAEANAIEPYKRPLSSMSPTIVVKNARPIMTLGAAGGPRIISQVVLAIINRIDLKKPLPAAIGSKRFHHQWSPDVLFVETGTPASWIESLEKRGHKVETLDYMGFTQGIIQWEKDDVLTGVADPRVGGSAGP